MRWKFTTWNGPLVVGSLLNLFSITYLGTLLEGSFIDSLTGLKDSEGPLRARFEAVVPENGHEEAAFLHAPFCLRGQQAPSWKSSVLGCKLEWNVPGDTPKGLFFVTSPRFSVLPRIILMPSIRSAVGAFVSGAGTERKLAESGNSATSRRGDQVTFQTSSTPEYRAIWGCRKFDSAEAGPGLIWIVWFHL